MYVFAHILRYVYVYLYVYKNIHIYIDIPEYVVYFFLMKTIAIVCQKGGVGKSTTALNLGAGLSRESKRILFIDLDAQGNLTETLGGRSCEPTAFEVMMESAPMTESIQNVSLGDVIASGASLSGADMAIVGQGKEYRLKNALDTVKGRYDYAVIDTPPALGILTINALTAAEEAIIPVQADIYGLRAIGQLSMTINAVREHCNPGLSIAGILVTRYNTRSILNRDMVELIDQTARALGTKAFTSTIREAVAIKESQACQSDIFGYAPKSGVAKDYQAFIHEYIING